MNRIIETWKRDIGKGFRALADLLMPRRCLVCDAKLEDEQLYLCPHCHSDMPLTRFWQLSHNPMADKLNELIQKELERRWNCSEGESGGEGIGEGDRSGMEQNLGSAAHCRPEPLARPTAYPVSRLTATHTAPMSAMPMPPPCSSSANRPTTSVFLTP